MQICIAAVLILIFGVGAARAQDITQGHIFANGETVTAASMNAIVGSATINNGFYTGKAAQTAIADADVLLVYSVSLAGFRQMSWANLIETNQTLVNILFATPDVARRSNFLAGVDAPAISNFLAGADSPTRSNFVLSFWSAAPTYTPAPTNTDLILVQNLRSNALQTVSIANAIGGAVQTNFTTTEQVIAIDAMADIAHGLPGTPQRTRWVLICKTAELNYHVNDEIDPANVYRSDNFGPVFFWGANTTNVFLNASHDVTTGGIPQTKNRTATTAGNWTAANWKAKCYATYYY